MSDVEYGVTPVGARTLILKDHGIRSRLQTGLVDLIGADAIAYAVVDRDARL